MVRGVGMKGRNFSMLSRVYHAQIRSNNVVHFYTLSLKQIYTFRSLVDTGCSTIVK